MQLIFTRRADKEQGEIGKEVANKFFGKKNTHDLSTGRICGIVNSFGTLVRSMDCKPEV